MNNISPEILCKILGHLDWRELLTAKTICHAWQRMLESHQFWHYFITNLLSSEPGVDQPEEHPKDYTAPELESWVIRCLRARTFWNTDDSSVNMTVTKCKSPTASDMNLLIPGGRWLLSLGQEGVLSSHDLDNPSFRERMVIDAGSNIEGQIFENIMANFVIWINRLKARLSFRVALWGDKREDEDDQFMRICIYQVDLVGHGKKAFLEAKSLITLQDYESTYTTTAAMSADHLVQNWCLDDREGIYLTPYNTIQGEEYSEKRIGIEFMKRWSDSQWTDICISPTDQIIRIGDKCIEIYTVQQVKSYYRRGIRKIAPLHRYAFNRSDFTCMSDPLTFRDRVWLVSVYHNKLSLTRISPGRENGELPTETIDFSGPFSKVEISEAEKMIGATNSIILRSDGSLDIIKYNWDSQMTCGELKRRRVCIPEVSNVRKDPRVIGVDESKGRIVFSLPGEHVIVVADLIAK